MTQLSQNPLVAQSSLSIAIRGGVPTANSLLIAKTFGKNHHNVMRTIRSLDCSPEFNAINFDCVEYIDQKGQAQPMYHVTRDGFMFLAMGFTGREAAAWKERFIAAFNAMEAQLRERERAQLTACHGFISATDWRLGELKRYMALGLRPEEIRRLLVLTKDALRHLRRRAESLGLIAPPPNLAALQQVARERFGHRAGAPA